MKPVWRVISVVLILIGVVWFLQGIGVLPGSFMSGRSEWAAYGGVSAAVGALLWVLAGRH